jgi:hypothetical protein
MRIYQLMDEVHQALGIEIPEKFKARLETAIAPHIGEIERVLTECKSFMDYYQHMVQRNELHPEMAGEMLKQADTLRFQFIEPLAFLQGTIVSAEYVAFQIADEKVVEGKKRQVEAWLQRLHKLEQVMREYSSWLDRVAYTLREVYRHR